jgi:hypothetical protein
MRAIPSALRRLAPLLCLLCVSASLHAQATLTASRLGDLQVGGGFSSAGSGYLTETERYTGGFLYADFDLRQHLGAEFTIHQVYSPYTDASGQNDQAGERSYEIGARYLRTYGRLVPYARLMVGRGVFNFPDSVANLAYNMGAIGIGADYKLKPYLNLRADFEYQRWFSFQQSSLSPNLISIGVAYHLQPHANR